MSRVCHTKKRLTHRTHFLFAPGHSPDLLEFPRKYLDRVESRKKFSRPWLPKRRKPKKHFFQDKSVVPPIFLEIHEKKLKKKGIFHFERK